jgi:hypothetical protein
MLIHPPRSILVIIEAQPEPVKGARRSLVVLVALGFVVALHGVIYAARRRSADLNERKWSCTIV